MFTTEYCIDLVDKLRDNTKHVGLLKCLSDVRRSIYVEATHGSCDGTFPIDMVWFKDNVVDVLHDVAQHTPGADMFINKWFCVFSRMYKEILKYHDLEKAWEILYIAMDWFNNRQEYVDFAHKLCCFCLADGVKSMKSQATCDKEFCSLLYFIHTFILATS